MTDTKYTPSLALSPEEAARLLGLGRTKLFELLQSGKLRSRKIGRRTLILRTDLQDFLVQLPTVGAGAPSPKP